MNYALVLADYRNIRGRLLLQIKYERLDLKEETLKSRRYSHLMEIAECQESLSRLRMALKIAQLTSERTYLRIS